MKKEQIDRINELAKKSRETGLTDAEKEEQLTLRQQYIQEYRDSLISQLDNTYIVDEEGNKRRLERKEDIPL